MNDIEKAAANSPLNPERQVWEAPKEVPAIKRPAYEGLSSKCTLDSMIVLAILMGGREHPCECCNADRAVCGGYPRP